MSISSLVLELWQFLFIRDWPEIRKSEMPPYEFCPISGDWDKLGIPNLAWIFLIKCYWMLENARTIAYTVSELLTENQQSGGGRRIKYPQQIRVKGTLMLIWKSSYMYMFIEKWYPENLPFLILRMLELFTRKVCIFLKK